MKQGQVQLVVSSALLGELRDVVSRPRMRKWFNLEDAEDMARALESRAMVVEPRITVAACRDPDDNYLLALSEASNAEFLVTRDEVLLALGRWKGTTILPPREFLRCLQELQGRQ
jgi:putative PIN family toxin of toxin-antitoxin system